MIPNHELVLTNGKWGTYWPLEIGYYPDGMPMVKHTMYHNDAYPIEGADTLILRPKSIQAFVAAMFYVDAMEERGHEIRNLILPFIPGSRQDRINPVGDTLFTAKSVAKMINDRSFDKVVVIDPHSLVAPALIDRCVQVPLDNMWAKFWQGYTAILAPDLGATKRAENAAKYMGKPIHHAEKVRDLASGKLIGFSAPTLKKGEHYLIVDDICDGGGTFLGLAGEIEKAEAFATLFVTHGIFSKGTQDLTGKFKGVYTTDSTVFEREPRGSVYTINIVERMIEWAL
jgi:ribose-phosphate pyrophosphokinase